MKCEVYMILTYSSKHSCNLLKELISHSEKLSAVCVAFKEVH